MGPVEAATAASPAASRAALVALLLALSASAWPSAAPGQVTGDPGAKGAAAEVGPWYVGASAGMPGIGATPFPVAFTVGLHVAYLPQGPLGLDLSVGTAPAGVLYGALPIGARTGVVFPLRGASGVFLPSVGVSYVGIAAGEGLESGILPHVGAAALSSDGLRLGVTLHWAPGARVPVWLLELGVLRAR